MLKRSQIAFYSIILFHLIIWTLLPSIIRHTISHDTVEAFVWGQQLSWGYDKNPYFVGWVTHFSFWLSHGQVWGYYFIQQLFVITGLWAIWRIGNLLYHPFAALVSVIILEGCLYFTAYVQINNDNFLLLGLIPLSVYCFYLAFQYKKLIYCLLTGVTMGLALMSKYSALFFIVGMLAFSVSKLNHFNSIFKNPFTYLGALLAILICIPNLIWVLNHNNITFQYLFERQAGDVNSFWKNHAFYPLSFILKNLLNIVPSLILFYFAGPFERSQPDLMRRHFIICIGIVPFVLVLFLSILCGWHLYWEWGVPFAPFLGLVLCEFFFPQDKDKNFSRFLIASCLMIIMTISIYFVVTLRSSNGRDTANYPAQIIADQVTQLWHDKYHSKLQYVAGSRYVAGYIAFYSKDHPRVLVEWNPLYSSGVSIAEVKKAGAIFIQDGYYGTSSFTMPSDFLTVELFPHSVWLSFPNLQALPLEQFNYYHHPKRQTGAILVGILAPQEAPK